MFTYCVSIVFSAAKNDTSALWQEPSEFSYFIMVVGT